MKEPVILPFLFLLAFISALILYTALDLFAVWGPASGSPFSLGFVLEHFPRSAFQAMVPAVITALVLAGFRMVRKPFSRFVGLAICLGASYLVLVNGMILLHALTARTKPPEPAVLQFVQPDALQRVGDAVVDAHSVSEGTLSGVLVYAGGTLSVYPSGRIVVDRGTLSITFPGNKARVLAQPADATSGTVFDPDRMTAFFLRDISVLTQDLETLLESSLGQFFVSCFSLLFLCAASMALLRLTRWPLVNVVFLIVAIRGYFSLYHFLAVTLRPEVTKAIADPLVVRLFPSVGLAVLGILLLLVDVLFVPADRWKQAETP